MGKASTCRSSKEEWRKNAVGDHVVLVLKAAKAVRPKVICEATQCLDSDCVSFPLLVRSSKKKEEPTEAGPAYKELLERCKEVGCANTF